MTARPRSRPAGIRRQGDAARLAQWLAMLLLAWQALVVPAHQHAPARIVAPTTTSAGATAAPVRHGSDDPVDCPVCREVAHAGTYLTPGTVAVAPPSPVAASTPLQVRPAVATGRPSHSWRSRAPPASGLA